MTIDSAFDLSQFRVTLFVGPQQVQGKPFTHSTVYNVKKRSWKGGIQVAVELNQIQVNQLSDAVGFISHERAQELLVQALSWCKLDLLLQSGITQQNQCLTADTFVAELNGIAPKKRDFIFSHIASELDLLPHKPRC